jgi:hypothetical protein
VWCFGCQGPNTFKGLYEAVSSQFPDKIRLMSGDGPVGVSNLNAFLPRCRNLACVVLFSTKKGAASVAIYLFDFRCFGVTILFLSCLAVNQSQP